MVIDVKYKEITVNLKILFGMCIAAVNFSALAQPTCDVLSDAVELEIKKSAAVFAEGFTDDSAPRATLREMRIANSLSLAQINLNIMAQNKCPPRQQPVNPMDYLTDALSCELAQQKGEKDSPACDKGNWKRLDDKASSVKE